MKKLIIGLALFSSFGTTFADTFGHSETMTMQSRAINNNASQGEGDTKTFSELMRTNQLYAMLLSLNSNVPEIAREAKYVMLLNEMHLMNEKLTVIAASLQQSKSIDVHPLENGGSPHG